MKTVATTMTVKVKHTPEKLLESSQKKGNSFLEKYCIPQ